MLGPASTAAASPGKSAAGASGQRADGAAVTRRLQQELMSVMTSGDASVSAFPAGDSLLAWTGTIRGAAGTAYEGLTFRLSISFPSDYPFSPPVVKFDTACFHPNVDLAGNICLDILKEKWSAAYSVLSILQSLQSLLGDPNNSSPLNVDAARAWDGDAGVYRETVLRVHKGGF